jgi:hypothetical protein
MENNDSLLTTAKEIMKRELLSKPVLRPDSFAEKRLKKLFHVNCIAQTDESIARSISACITGLSENRISDKYPTAFPKSPEIRII